MIPSLLEQVLAARTPTKQEVMLQVRIEDRMERVREAVRRTGNVTAAQMAAMTNYSIRTCRETLVALERRGELISWKPVQSNRPRRWALAKPAPRVNKQRGEPK